MKIKILMIFLFLNLISCSVSRSRLNNVSNQIEVESEIEYVLKSKTDDSNNIAKNRNIQLRLKTFLKHEKEILFSLKESFYLIESYDYDLGYVFVNYLIIDGNIYVYLKDDFLLELIKEDLVPNDDIFYIKNKLDKKQAQFLKNLSIFRENANCSTAYYVYEIDKKSLKLVNNIMVDCFPND